MSKKRWLLYGLFGLVFYLLFLIIELPASWFAWGLNRYTQGTVRLDPIAGSLWHGNGRLAIYYPRTTLHDFGQTEWRINPLWLFAGRVQLSLQANNPERQIKTTLGMAGNNFLLKDTEAMFPASLVTQLYPPAALIGPQGKVRINTEGLTLAPGKAEGAAVLEWLSAGSSLSAVQPLGDYRVDIAGAGKHANLKLTTLRGALELTGQGTWQAETGQIQLNGSAVPRERAVELKPLLDLFGTDQGAGRRALALNFLLTPAVRPTPLTPASPPVKSK